MEGSLSSDGKPLPNDTILSRVTDLTLANAMPLDFSSFPASYPSIISAYDLDRPSSAAPDTHREPSLLKKPSLAFNKWTDLLGDLNFRIPPLYFALNAADPQSQPAGDIFIYSIQATNPFPLWPNSYRRANHAINEIFLFNVAEDMVPSDHADEYRGAVADMQAAWIQFCHGIKPWKSFKGGAKTKMGPVYVFQNGGLSREYETIREAEGAQTVEKWMAVLEAMGVGRT
jgi:hypothetical protein